MGSGFNGQSFAFKGYLSAQTQQRQADLRHLEQIVKKTGQTQIFIETPYRNEALFQSALESLHPTTLFSVALNLGGPESWQLTAKIEAWKTIQRPSFEKIPAIFIIGQWALS
jgi:16S rRNA (cytidine1402-2'-O)-methyltransferase